MLLDSASLYFRAFYGVPETVVAPDGTPINAARGFLDMIAMLVGKYQPDRLGAPLDKGPRRPPCRGGEAPPPPGAAGADPHRCAGGGRHRQARSGRPRGRRR